MHSRFTAKISVRALVEATLKSGDLYQGYSGSSRMVEGIKAHHLISSSAVEEYMPEVPVSFLIEKEHISLEINGRIDGVIISEGSLTIDEIKSTGMDLDELSEDFSIMHWAQAKCYAFIYGIQNGFENVKVQLTYYQVDSGEIRIFSKLLSIAELEEFFYGLADKYLDWLGTVSNWSHIRDESIKSLEFPFKSYRKGQREFAAAVYRTIRDEGKIFAQAPTGTGKTMAALFPSIKAIGEGHISKIFYLTAKTITRSVAESTLDKMREKGLKLKAVTITAKEKVCCNKGSSCDPEECEFVRGYYDRVDTAIRDIFAFDSFTRELVEEHALKHRLCPFEFSLDLSLWADCIICDYNYVFDPAVYLKRFFSTGGGDYAFLIDEAHNLVDRTREMFSAEIRKKAFLDLKKEAKGVPELAKSLGVINKHMIELRKKLDGEGRQFCVQKEQMKELCRLLRTFINSAEKHLSGTTSDNYRNLLFDVYFEVFGFLRIAEFYDERYVTYYEKSGSDIKVKMFCLDPSFLLYQAMKRGRASILFSATFSPMKYFMRMLGGEGEQHSKQGINSPGLRLPSPFNSENLCVMVDSTTSTRYNARELSYDKIAGMIKAFAGVRTGNYIVYFPSYKYMEEVYLRFCGLDTGIRTIYQKPDMTEQGREEFLAEFSEYGRQSLVGFAVMGGVFGEGIDLTGDRLSGVVIVGVGLPQICNERNIIKSYFDEMGSSGFEYAYMYPGMNKVMQAVGRVIRTEDDKGAVLLIDERFVYNSYKELFPPEWYPVKEVRSIKELKRTLDDFWTGHGR